MRAWEEACVIVSNLPCPRRPILLRYLLQLKYRIGIVPGGMAAQQNKCGEVAPGGIPASVRYA